MTAGATGLSWILECHPYPEGPLLSLSVLLGQHGGYPLGVGHGIGGFLKALPTTTCVSNQTFLALSFKKSLCTEAPGFCL